MGAGMSAIYTAVFPEKVPVPIPVPVIKNLVAKKETGTLNKQATNCKLKVPQRTQHITIPHRTHSLTPASDTARRTYRYLPADAESNRLF